MRTTTTTKRVPFAWIESWPVILATLAAEAAVFFAVAAGIIQ